MICIHYFTAIYSGRDSGCRLFVRGKGVRVSILTISTFTASQDFIWICHFFIVTHETKTWFCTSVFCLRIFLNNIWYIRQEWLQIRKLMRLINNVNDLSHSLTLSLSLSFSLFISFSPSFSVPSLPFLSLRLCLSLSSYLLVSHSVSLSLCFFLYFFLSLSFSLFLSPFHSLSSLSLSLSFCLFTVSV